MSVEDIVLQVVRFLVAILFAVAAQYLAIKVFDRTTTRIDELEELKKGNLAVGVVLAAVILSVATIIAGGVSNVVPENFNITRYDFWSVLGGGILSLGVAVIVAVVALFIALKVFDSMTGRMDVEKELRKGNMSIAVLLAAVLYATAIVIQAGLPSF